MAITTCTVTSNRRDPSRGSISGSVSGVAVDASVLEQFRLPSNYGDLLVEQITCDLGALSGAYVAPAPAFDGFLVSIYSPSALVDILMAQRWVNYSTASARPQLVASIEFHHPVLVRQNELITIQAPIIAGAGVTATVDLFVRGIRLRQA